MILKDKVAIITGSAQGIGKAIALRLAKEGANTVITDIDESIGSSTLEEIKQFTSNTLFCKVDVSSIESTENLINKTLDKFNRIDILVNNAGITKDSLLIRMSQEDWDKVININLKGVFNCTKAVIRTMVKQRAGRIVNIASVVGMIGNAGQANYAASKAGVIAFTKTCAKEFASRNINVNAIAPGFIQTRMTEVLSEDIKQSLLKQIPMNRFGTPDDVAKAVLFLVSDAADYITGQVIRIDGGMVM